jgi:hypothetical protein
MRELPDIPDMLSTVRDFLAQLVPELDKGSKFEAQVAIYLLDIAQRELAAPPAPKAGAMRLCADIRAGACDASWETTLDTEFEAVIARVRIARPDYMEAK